MFVFSSLLLALSIIQALASCPDTWYKNNEQCYYMPDQTANNFDEARKYCREQAKTSLAIIESQEENDYIQSNILQHATDNQLYLGFERDGSYFVKTNNKKRLAIGSYTNWNPGEPSGGGEYCVQMLSNGKWNDIPCNSEMSFLCKSSGEFYAASCPGDFKPYSTFGYGTSCYLHYTRGLNFYDAENACVELGAALANVSSAQENELLKNKFVANTRLKRIWHGSERYTYHDYFSGNHYTNWNSGEPNEPWGRESCPEMDETGKWNDIHCSTELLEFVCKTHADYRKYHEVTL